MTTQEFLSNFWDYYLILEEKFEKSTRYVQLSSDNYATYSIEFVNQIQTICSEVDVVMKIMSGLEEKERCTIKDYAEIILKKYREIVEWEIVAKGIRCKPFEGWETNNASKSLPWWNAYNNVKHNRNINLKEANLKNVLHSLMGLYLLEMMYFKKLADEENVIDTPKKRSILFTIKDWKRNRFWGDEIEIEKIGELVNVDGGTVSGNK